MHSINCLFDHGRQQEQQQQKIVGPLKHQLADSFPTFPAHTSMGTCDALCCAALLKFVQAAKVFECIQAFTHSHTHALILSHTRQRRGGGICSCCCIANSNYDNFKCISDSSRKCCILFSAYRRTTFSLNNF